MSNKHKAQNKKHKQQNKKHKTQNKNCKKQKKCPIQKPEKIAPSSPHTSINATIQCTSTSDKPTPSSSTRLTFKKVALSITTLLGLLSFIHLYDWAVQTTPSNHESTLRQTTTIISTSYYD